MDKLLQLLMQLGQNKVQLAILSALVVLIGLVADIKYQQQQEQVATDRQRMIQAAWEQENLKNGDRAVDMFNSLMNYGGEERQKRK